MAKIDDDPYDKFPCVRAPCLVIINEISDLNVTLCIEE